MKVLTYAQQQTALTHTQNQQTVSTRSNTIFWKKNTPKLRLLCRALLNFYFFCEDTVGVHCFCCMIIILSMVS